MIERKAMVIAMMKRVLSPSEVCLMQNALTRLSALPKQRALVITGMSATKSGALDKALIQLEKSGVFATVESIPSDEPTAQLVNQISREVAKIKPDLIICIGGGAVIDLAKFVWALYEHPELKFEGPKPFPIPNLGSKAKLIAIPTTGSGSEASIAAIITDSNRKIKVPYVSAEWLPEIVILDPMTTVSLSPEMTAATSFDALAHAIEAYVSRLTNPLSQSFSISAINMIINALPIAYAQPDNINARSTLQNASYLAGLAQSTASTGITHCLSHGVGAEFGTSHAYATAFFLMPGLQFNAQKINEKYEQLAIRSGFDGYVSMFNAIETLYRQTNLPTSLTTLLGSKPEVNALHFAADKAAADVCKRSNPTNVSREDLSLIVKGLI